MTQLIIYDNYYTTNINYLNFEIGHNALFLRMILGKSPNSLENFSISNRFMINIIINNVKINKR